MLCSECKTKMEPQGKIDYFGHPDYWRCPKCHNVGWADSDYEEAAASDFGFLSNSEGEREWQEE